MGEASTPPLPEQGPTSELAGLLTGIEQRYQANQQAILDALTRDTQEATQIRSAALELAVADREACSMLIFSDDDRRWRMERAVALEQNLLVLLLPIIDGRLDEDIRAPDVPMWHHSDDYSSARRLLHETLDVLNEVVAVEYSKVHGNRLPPQLDAGRIASRAIEFWANGGEWPDSH